MMISVHGKEDQIAINAKLLNINSQFYGFSSDVIETINLLMNIRINTCSKIASVGAFTSSIVMCKIFFVMFLICMSITSFFPWL